MPTFLIRVGKFAKFRPMTRPLHRRDAIRPGVSAAISAPWSTLGAEIRGVRSLTLTEPAGLQREAEPVSTIVPAAEPGRDFRLIRDGRAIPAQFRPFVGPNARRGVALDFAADLGPAESAGIRSSSGPRLSLAPLKFWMAFAPVGSIDGRSPSPHAILDPIRIAWDRPSSP